MAIRVNQSLYSSPRRSQNLYFSPNLNQNHFLAQAQVYLAVQASFKAVYSGVKIICLAISKRSLRRKTRMKNRRVTAQQGSTLMGTQISLQKVSFRGNPLRKAATRRSTTSTSRSSRSSTLSTKRNPSATATSPSSQPLSPAQTPRSSSSCSDPPSAKLSSKAPSTRSSQK